MAHSYNGSVVVSVGFCANCFKDVRSDMLDFDGLCSECSGEDEHMELKTVSVFKEDADDIDDYVYVLGIGCDEVEEKYFMTLQGERDIAYEMYITHTEDGSNVFPEDLKEDIEDVILGSIVNPYTIIGRLVIGFGAKYSAIY